MKNHKTDTAPESRGLADQGVECRPSERSAAWWRGGFGGGGSRVLSPPLRPTSEGLAARLQQGLFSCPFVIAQSPRPAPQPIHQSAAASAKPWRPGGSGGTKPNPGPPTAPLHP